MFGRKVIAQYLAKDGSPSQTAADKYADTDFATAVAPEFEADIVRSDYCTVCRSGVDGDFEFARQEGEFRMEGRPLAEDFAIWPGINDFIRGYAGKRIGGDIADAVT